MRCLQNSLQLFIAALSGQSPVQWVLSVEYNQQITNEFSATLLPEAYDIWWGEGGW